MSYLLLPSSLIALVIASRVMLTTAVTRLRPYMCGSYGRGISCNINHISGGRNQAWGQGFFILQEEQVWNMAEVFLCWHVTHMGNSGFSSVTFWKSPGPSKRALCVTTSEFGRRHKHTPDVFRSYWWAHLPSRLSFGRLFQRCSSTPQAGANQAGAKKAASPSGGPKISHGQTSGVMSAQKNKSRGWVFL